MGLWINRYIVRSSVLQMIAIKCFFWRSCHALTDEYNPWMKGRRDSSFLPSKEYVWLGYLGLLGLSWPEGLNGKLADGGIFCPFLTYVRHVVIFLTFQGWAFFNGLWRMKVISRLVLMSQVDVVGCCCWLFNWGFCGWQSGPLDLWRVRFEGLCVRESIGGRLGERREEREMGWRGRWICRGLGRDCGWGIDWL